MSRFRPTAQQERWMATAARLGVPKGTAWVIERSGEWKTVSLLTRCAFFVLGVIATGMAAGVLLLLSITWPYFCAGVVAIVLAEAFIAQRRLFRAGIEEALAMTGSLLIVGQIIESTHYENTTAAFWLMIAFAAVGLRLLNPLFLTAAAVSLAFLLYFVAKQQVHGSASASMLASFFSFAVATVALAAGSAQFTRPSVDRILDWLVIVMPVCGYALLVIYYSSGLTLGALRGNLVMLLPLLLVSSFALVSIATGLRRRRHAPLFAAMLCIGCIGYEVRKLTGFALEYRLIMWGTLAMLTTLGLIVVLRKPRNGITSSEVDAGAGPFRLLEIASVSAMSAQAATVAPTPVQPEYEGAGGGGSFGGGGASGKF